jgi:hypothetical protein
LNSRGNDPVAPLLSSIISRRLGFQAPEASAIILGGRNYAPEAIVHGVSIKPENQTVPKTLPAGTESVADGGVTAYLLGIALLGSAVMKRKFSPIKPGQI